MKRSRLPLTALRAFEAAGRHQSFKRAAEELTVSEAAISRQIRDLEKNIGVLLFQRDHRAVHLTAKGRDLLDRVTLSFDGLDAALSSVAGARQEVVAVSVEPTFANLFLVPQLGDFSELHPELDVRIEANSALLDLREPDGPTLAIRYSLERSSWPAVESRHLCDDWLTPMASPELAETLNTAEDLLSLRLLKDETGSAWTRWLTAAGIEQPPVWGPTFSNAASAVQGAETGQGAVLGNRSLCRRLIAARRLVAPFELSVPNGAYWLVSRKFAELTGAELAFCDWVSALVQTKPQQAGTAARKAVRAKRSGLK